MPDFFESVGDRFQPAADARLRRSPVNGTRTALRQSFPHSDRTPVGCSFIVFDSLGLVASPTIAGACGKVMETAGPPGS